jgi:hypothetical protein
MNTPSRTEQMQDAPSPYIEEFVSIVVSEEALTDTDFVLPSEAVRVVQVEAKFKAVTLIHVENPSQEIWLHTVDDSLPAINPNLPGISLSYLNEHPEYSGLGYGKTLELSYEDIEEETPIQIFYTDYGTYDNWTLDDETNTISFPEYVEDNLHEVVLTYARLVTKLLQQDA